MGNAPCITIFLVPYPTGTAFLLQLFDSSAVQPLISMERKGHQHWYEYDYLSTNFDSWKVQPLVTTIERI